MKTTTKSGIEVELTGEEWCGQHTVKAEFSHSKLGSVILRSNVWGSMNGSEGIIGFAGQQRVCLTVPKVDFEAAMREARLIGEREIEAIKSGAVKIALSYHDGEIISGYFPQVRACELLKALGVAKDVSGWGTLVDSKLVEALGKEFTYAQAAEFARPALEAKAAEEDAQKREREEKFAEARLTGKPVRLDSWTEDCSARGKIECSVDYVVLSAMPDGTTHKDRTHTY